MENKTLTIRASSLPSYQDCARRAIIPILYRRIVDSGYVLRDTRPGVGQCIGTACHAAAYSALDHKKHGTIGTSTDFHVDQAVSAYDTEIVDGIEWDAVTGNKNDAYKQIRTLVGSFCGEILPMVQPDGIEMAFEAVVPQSELPYEVYTSGHVDLDTVDWSVEDWKFGSVHRSHHAQMGDYSLLEKSARRTVSSVVVTQFPRTRISKPYPGAQRHVLDISVCERAAKSVLNHMIHDIAEYERTGSPWSFGCNPGSMMCSDKYCRARGTEWCEITKGMGDE
jgi:hypothetical protein